MSINEEDFEDTDEKPRMVQKYTMDENRIHTLVTKISQSKKTHIHYINTYEYRKGSSLDLFPEYKAEFGRSDGMIMPSFQHY